MASSARPLMTTTAGKCAALARRCRKVSSPVLSGRPKSSNTRSMPPWAIRRRPASKLSTHSRERTTPLPAGSIFRINRASPELSSISRMVVCSRLMASPRRQFDYGQPEFLDHSHHLEELIEIHGLGDVAVGVQIVGLENILL